MWPPMKTRRAMLAQTGALLAGAAGVWWLRDKVVWPAPHPQFAGGGATSGWLPFLAGPQLVVTLAEANGHSLGALIDSGAQSSVIDRGAAERLGVQGGAPIPMLAYGVTGKPQIGRGATLSVRLGALSLPALRTAVLDLSPIVQATGGRVELVLGQDVLRRVVAEIDFPRRRLAMFAPGAAPATPGLSPAPAALRGHELTTPVTVEGYRLDAVVDTGSSAPLALSEGAARAAGLLTGRPVRVEDGVTFGGASRNRVVIARSIRFAGRAQITGAPVQIYPDGAHGALPAGLLGVGALSPFRVRLDLGAGALALAAENAGSENGAPGDGA